METGCEAGAVGAGFRFPCFSARKKGSSLAFPYSRRILAAMRSRWLISSSTSMDDVYSAPKTAFVRALAFCRSEEMSGGIVEVIQIAKSVQAGAARCYLSNQFEEDN